MPAAGVSLAVGAVAMLAPSCGGQHHGGGGCPHGVPTVVAQPCNAHTWHKCPKWMGVNWFCGPAGSCDCRDPLTGTLAVECTPPLECGATMARVVGQTCLSATRIPAEQWCSSRCYEQLQPMMQQCQDSLPPYVLSGLAPATARLDECGETDVGACVVPAPPPGGSQDAAPVVAACDIGKMIALCQGVTPSETDLSALCNAPCTRAMIACADDPEVAGRVDAAEIAALRSAKNNCAENAHAASGEGPAPGDGACDLTLMATLCDGLTDVGTQDTANLCSDPCAKEMVDCIDDPALVSQANPHRSTIM
jgi:hypothetical protein